MKENVGRADRAARGVLGPALMSLGYGRLGGREGQAAGLLTMVSGAVLIESAVTRVCPINALLGIDTRSSAERARDETACAQAESEG